MNVLDSERRPPPAYYVSFQIFYGGHSTITMGYEIVIFQILSRLCLNYEIAMIKLCPHTTTDVHNLLFVVCDGMKMRRNDKG